MQHPVPSGTPCQRHWGHSAFKDPVLAPCTLRDPVPASSGTLCLQGPCASTLHPQGPCASAHAGPCTHRDLCQQPASVGTPFQHAGGHCTHSDALPASCIFMDPVPTPKEDLAPAGTHAGTHGGPRPSALQLWEPCTCGCPTATHLREVAGQPIAVAGGRGGPQGEVEGPELAGSHSLWGDVELAGGTVPQGHPAAGKLGRGKRVEPVPHSPPQPPDPTSLPC